MIKKKKPPKLCKHCKKPLENRRWTYHTKCAIEARKIRQKKKNSVKLKGSNRLVTKKGLKKKLDTLWSKIIRNKGRCEACGKKEHLNAHHIYSRKNEAIRWDIENGVCLCAGCHTFSSHFSAHQTPTEFTEWLIKHKGHDFLDRLKGKAHMIKAKSLEQWHDYLTEVYNEQLQKKR